MRSLFSSVSTLNSQLSRLQSFLFYLWIALLPTQLGFHYWLAEALVRGLRVDYLAVTIYASELVLLALVGVTLSRHSGALTVRQGDRIPSRSIRSLVNILNRILSSRRLHRDSRMTWLGMGVLLLAWSVFQLLWVALPLTQLVFILKLTLWLLGIWAIKKITWSRRVVVRIFSLQLIVLAGLSLAQLVTQGSMQGIWYWMGERAYTTLTPGIATEGWGSHFWVRPYGTFSHPNVLAGYAVVVGIVIQDLRFKIKNLRLNDKKKSQSWFPIFHLQSSIFNFESLILVGVVSSLTLVLISFSQAAWLAVIIAGLIWWLFKKPVPMVWLQWGLVLSLIVPLVLLSLPFFLSLSPASYPLPPTSYLPESLTLRNDLFRAYWQMPFFEHFIGLGWHGFLAQLPTVTSYLIEPRHLQPIHNSLWYLISAMGWLPMVVIAGYWLLDIRKKLQVTSYKLQGISIINLLPWLVVLLLASVDHYWVTQVQTQGLLLFLLVQSSIE